MIRNVLICFSCIKPVITHNLPLDILCIAVAYGMCSQYGLCNIWVWNGTGRALLSLAKSTVAPIKREYPGSACPPGAQSLEVVAEPSLLSHGGSGRGHDGADGNPIRHPCRVRPARVLSGASACISCTSASPCSRVHAIWCDKLAHSCAGTSARRRRLLTPSRNSARCVRCSGLQAKAGCQVR